MLNLYIYVRFEEGGFHLCFFRMRAEEIRAMGEPAFDKDDAVDNADDDVGESAQNEEEVRATAAATLEYVPLKGQPQATGSRLQWPGASAKGSGEPLP